MKLWIPTTRMMTARRKCPWAAKFVPDDYGITAYETEYEWLVESEKKRQAKLNDNSPKMGESDGF